MMDPSEEQLAFIYQLEECLTWIQRNSYSSVALQFPKDEASISSRVVLTLQQKTQCKICVIVSSMCCVDYLSVQHLGATVQAIIHFGKVCLTSSSLTDSIPVLYIFNNFYDPESLKYVEDVLVENESKKILFLFQPNDIPFVSNLAKQIELKHSNLRITFPKFKSHSMKWFFASNNDLVLNGPTNESSFEVGPYVLENEITDFDLVIHLGLCNSLLLKLSFDNLLQIDVKNKSQTLIYRNQELKKRIAKVEKFKCCQKIGILFTNPLPKINDYFITSKKLGEKCGKKVYLITIIQTMDEFKLGNFLNQLDAFVLVNSCWCSSILDALNYCVPILNWIEFEIACLVRKSYGGVDWNEDVEDELEAMQEIDHSAQNDGLNQIIEADVFQRSTWFGLQVDAGKTEATQVKEGQKGIASAYEHELF